MKNANLLICFVLILAAMTSLVFADDAMEPPPLWSANTAYVLPAKRVELGLFQPLRYGFSDNVEFSMHPLAFFVAPNFDVKWAHHKVAGFAIASRHGLTCPTPLLRLISKKGIGGIISPEFDIPFIFSMQNEILASKPVFGKHLFTGKLGLNFALRSGDLDSRTTIDLPIVFARTSVYYHNVGIRVGSDLQGPVTGKLNYLIDGDLFYYPGADADVNMAFEHKGMLLWNKSDGFQMSLGYILSYGEYPFGTQWHLLPLFDVQWGWKR